MSKSKQSGAAHYEILFAIPNKFTEDEAQAVIAKTKKLIEDAGGQVTMEEYWGKKRLAYPINHNNYGYYQLFEFDLERNALAKVEKTLQLSTDILRFLTLSKAVKTAEQIKKETKIKEKISLKKAKEEETKKSSAAPKTSSKKESSDDEKTDMKNLDEKLEGILNAKDLI